MQNINKVGNDASKHTFSLRWICIVILFFFISSIPCACSIFQSIYICPQDILQSNSDTSVQVYRNPPAIQDEMDCGHIAVIMDTGFIAVNSIYMVYFYENIDYDNKKQLRVMKRNKKCSQFEPHQDVFVKIERGRETGRVLVDYEPHCEEIFLNDGNSNQLIYLEFHTHLSLMYLICLNAGEVTRKFDIPGRKIVDFYAVKNALKNWVYRRTTKQFISMLKNIRGK